MILGRFIFGLGGESIGITCNVLLVNWFAGKELSLANVSARVRRVIFFFLRQSI